MTDRTKSWNEIQEDFERGEKAAMTDKKVLDVTCESEKTCLNKAHQEEEY